MQILRIQDIMPRCSQLESRYLLQYYVYSCSHVTGKDIVKTSLESGVVDFVVSVLASCPYKKVFHIRTNLFLVLFQKLYVMNNLRKDSS